MGLALVAAILCYLACNESERTSDSVSTPQGPERASPAKPTPSADGNLVQADAVDTRPYPPTETPRPVARPMRWQLVVADSDGHLLPGILVEFRRPGRISASVTTDLHGVATLEGGDPLPSAPIEVRLRDGPFETHVELDPETTELTSPTVLVMGATKPLLLPVSRDEPNYLVLVRGELGQPLPHALVTAHTSGRIDPIAYALTDAEGEASLAVSSDVLDLVVSAVSYAVTRECRLERSRGPAEVRLARAPTIQGEVRSGSATGPLVTDFEVCLLGDPGSAARKDSDPVWRRFSGSNGRFVWRPPEVKHSVHIGVRAAGHAPTVLGPITFGPLGITATVVLRPVEASIRGRVLDHHTDLAIAGAGVAQTGSDRESLSPEIGARTDAEGRFQLNVAALEQGTSLRIRAQGYLARDLPLKLNATDGGVELDPIRLTRSARLEIEVTSSEGAPLGGDRLEIESDEGIVEHLVPESGRLTLEVASGAVKLVLSSLYPDRNGLSCRRDLAPGGHTKIVLRADASHGVLRGRVNLGGVATLGVEITLTNSQGQFGTTSDENGEFQFPALLPGSARVHAAFERDRVRYSGSVVIEVVAGDNPTTLDLEIRR